MKIQAIKVCGMRDEKNLDQVLLREPDLVGFILTPRSPRLVETSVLPMLVRQVHARPGVKAVGIFVNEDKERVAQIVRDALLDVVQLHGDESPDYCRWLRATLSKILIIKAVPARDEQTVRGASQYEGAADYILFDAPSAQGGGAGKTFPWTLLSHYTGTLPFFLGGGLGPTTISEALKYRSHPSFSGVDLNSKLESAPGIKDVRLVDKVIQVIRSSNLGAV